jgi:opacity protein-like surface antigen
MNAAAYARRLALLCATFAVLSAFTVQAADAPPWAIEVKGGRYYPDLEDYETFYGKDNTTYLGLAGAYRINNWLEFGMELGYSRDDGVGLLPNAGTTGGQVEYTVLPLQAYLNFRYDIHTNQRFVPYVGIGVATAWYRQRIDQQPTREGRSDVGGAARAGIQLLLNGLDKRGANYYGADKPIKTFLFLEGQYYSAKVDDIDIGGQNYVLGLRLEF